MLLKGNNINVLVLFSFWILTQIHHLKTNSLSSKEKDQFEFNLESVRPLDPYCSYDYTVFKQRLLLTLWVNLFSVGLLGLGYPKLQEFWVGLSYPAPKMAKNPKF